MAGYDSIIARDASDDPLVPEQYRPELIAEITEQSAVLTSARKVPLTSKTSRQPVLSVLPSAYWVNGDTGLKETDSVDFKNAIMTAEELAVIVPIPEAYLDDSATPVWSVVRPLLAEAMGIAIDNPILWGVSKPATWTDPALIPGAVAAGNKVVIGGTGEDIGQDIAKMGQLLAQQGYNMNGFTCEPGFDWQLIGSRAQDGSLIYGGPISQGQPGTLYGRPLRDVKNGSWDSSTAHLLGGDWSKALVGIRQDITYKVFTEGVISDAEGKIVLNLMQQDSVAVRVVMRLGYNLPIPVSRLAADDARFPFAVLQPTGGAAQAAKPKVAS